MMPGIKRSLAKSATRCRLQTSLLHYQEILNPDLKKKKRDFYYMGKLNRIRTAPRHRLVCGGHVCL